MFSHNGKISARQTAILLILQMLNIGVLILPRICTSYVGRNGYILPILAIILGIIYLLCIRALVSVFPQYTFAEIVQAVLPRGVAEALLIALALKILIDIGLEVRIFGEVVSQVMLPKTPMEVILLVMLLTTWYMAKSGIEAVGRMGEILVYFVIIPLVIVILIGVFKVDYIEVTPFFQTTIKNICLGTITASFCFVPLQFLLIINGLMKEPSKMLKAGITAIIVVGILDGIIVLLTICKLGVGETQRQLWPVLILMKSIGAGSSVVQKQEILMLIIWIFTVSIYVGSGLCFVSIITSRCCKFRRENIFVLPLIPVVYFIAIVPSNLAMIYSLYVKYQYYFGIWFLIPIPLILLFIAKVRRIGNEK